MLPAGGPPPPEPRDTWCTRPTLSGLGERSGLLTDAIDLALHTEDIAAVLHYEDLRDVILVGHSYGGMVITGAADKAADRVGKLVFLDAATPAQRPIPGGRGRTGDQRRPAHGSGGRRD